MTIKKMVEMLAKFPQDAEAAMPSVLGSGLDEITDIEFDESRRLVIFEFEPRKPTSAASQSGSGYSSQAHTAKIYQMQADGA